MTTTDYAQVVARMASPEPSAGPSRLRPILVIGTLLIILMAFLSGEAGSKAGKKGCKAGTFDRCFSHCMATGGGPGPKPVMGCHKRCSKAGCG
jgi:hypothetical protein